MQSCTWLHIADDDEACPSSLTSTAPARLALFGQGTHNLARKENHMKSIKMVVATLGLGVVALSSSFAQAHTSVSVGIDLGLPLLFRAPVYYAPPPVYYAPPQVYYESPRVVYERRDVYPQPVYFGGRWEQNGYRHDYDRDRRGYRDRDDDRDHEGRRDGRWDGHQDRWDGREHGRWDRR